MTIEEWQALKSGDGIRTALGFEYILIKIIGKNSKTGQNEWEAFGNVKLWDYKVLEFVPQNKIGRLLYNFEPFEQMYKVK